MDIAIFGAIVAGLVATSGVVMVNRAARRRRIDHAVRW